MSVILRTGNSKMKNVPIDYQGSKMKNIPKVIEQEHILGYIKAGTSGKNQIFWFESNKSGRIYIIANKELYALGFYKKSYKTKDLKVIGTVSKNNKLTIKKIL